MNGVFKRLEQSALIPGYADFHSTGAYFDRLGEFLKQKPGESWLREVTPDRIHASRIGFGSYRISRGVFTHTEALRRAILTGTNVIDTSSNYSDGASEALIGDVLRSLIGNSLYRNEIIVITKGGYIQGRNLPVHAGKTYGDLIEKSPGVHHSMDPRFLTAEIDQSRNRLGLETIDAYLIQNPEIHLQEYIRSGIPEDEAREKYRISLLSAMERLESLREDGLIARYGISTNDLAYCHSTDFGKLYESAGPGFQVLQIPVNLIEYLPAGKKSTLCSAYDRLWIIGHRPFNAVLHNDLFRLAGPVEESGSNQVVNPCLELEDLRRKILVLEKEIINSHEGKTFRFDDRNPSFSSILTQYRGRFNTPEHLENTLSPIIHALKQTINRLNLISRTEEQRDLVQSYTMLSNTAVRSWEKCVRHNHSGTARKIQEMLQHRFPDLDENPLSLQNIRIILSTRCPDTILAGMRRPEYVEILRLAYRLPLIDRESIGRELPSIREELSKMGRKISRHGMAK